MFHGFGVLLRKDFVEDFGIPLTLVTAHLRISDSKSKSCSTPLKINMEHNHGGLEDHFPF